MLLIVNFLIYVLSIVVLHNYFNLTAIDIMFFLKILLITAISWIPIHLLTICIEKIDPSDYTKIRQEGVR